jgi:hypothetical protein
MTHSRRRRILFAALSVATLVATLYALAAPYPSFE